MLLGSVLAVLFILSRAHEGSTPSGVTMNLAHKPWRPGAPAPTRPPQTLGYDVAMERYADDLERMLRWLAEDYARFSTLVSEALP